MKLLTNELLGHVLICHSGGSAFLFFVERPEMCESNNKVRRLALAVPASNRTYGVPVNHTFAPPAFVSFAHPICDLIPCASSLPACADQTPYSSACAKQRRFGVLLLALTTMTCALLWSMPFAREQD